MPISLQELTNKKATVSVLDGQLSVTYNADMVTAQMLINTAMPKKETDESVKAWLQANIDTLVTLLDSWDLMDKPEAEGGQPLPITKEVLTNTLPLRITFEIFTAVMRDFQVGEGKRSA